jgi:uncharacterized protein YcbK (DUF882 family)
MAMGTSAVATAVSAAPGRGWAQDAIGDYLDQVLSTPSAPRRVVIHNLHTDERVDATYFDDGRYVPDALAAVNHVMRDFRTGDVHFMDPQLLDLMHALSKTVETAQPFQIISGYRSPKTNAMLHEQSAGVAVNSFHMRGMATDIRLPDVSLSHLHKAALAMQRGGVGYYPESDFIHVDIGPVRTWG